MSRNYGTIQKGYEISHNAKAGKRALIEGFQKSIADKKAKIEKIKREPYPDFSDIAKIEGKIAEIEIMIIDQCRENNMNDMLGDLAEKAAIRNKELKKMGLIR